MSPAGRPTDAKKESRLQFRLSDGDVEMLDYCAEVLGLTKAEVIRQGIELMYTTAQKQAQK